MIKESIAIGPTAKRLEVPNKAYISNGFNQFRGLLRIDVDRNNKIQYLITDIFANLSSIHLKSFLVGGIAILLIYSLQKVHKRFPGPLLVVVLGILFMKFFESNFSGVQIVKKHPGRFTFFFVT